MVELLSSEVEVEEPSPAQAAYYNRINEEVRVFKQKLEQLSKLPNITVENHGEITLVEFNQLPQQANQNFVVVDPSTLNLLVTGTQATSVPQIPVGVPVAAVPVNSVPVGAVRVPPNVASSSPPPLVTPTSTPRLRVRGGLTGRGGTAIAARRTVTSLTVRAPTPQSVRGRGAHHSTPSRSEGGKDVVDLTDEDFDAGGVPNNRPEVEVSINKSSEKTFPSLVVLARPYLNVQKFDTTQIQAERSKLDDKVKQILNLSACHLTEWLLQHGLLRSEQTCNATGGRGKAHAPLKLGMYSDSSKFPFSGGYVWISECCPSQFVSVFSGSIFEAAAHPPPVVLKLIYHWACQTGVQNVIQWVKVETIFVKTLYTNLRAVCTAAVHEKFPVFGGPNKRVQIGVISLGTTTTDGSSRKVKVEVLGLLDEETKMIRIRAVEPVQQDPGLSQAQQMKKRFMKTLDLLPKWVHQQSEVIVDYTVDKQALIDLGYKKVIQVSAGDTVHGYQIMEYLRKVIPRMFQNTLSLLSRQIIQQFLDELSWREAYGAIASKAFESIIQHICEQTRLNTGGTLLNRLARITASPFRNWEYNSWLTNCKKSLVEQSPSPRVIGSTSSSSARKPTVSQSSVPPGSSLSTTSAPSTPLTSSSSNKNLTPASTQSSAQASPKKVENLDPTMIALEPYYYGVLDGDNTKHKYVPFFTQCYFCRTDFKNVLKLTEHLILHALNKNLDSVSDPKDICRSCLKIRLPGSKQHHLQTCQGGPLGIGCRICLFRAKDKGSLVYHMTKFHHQLDMPYLCCKCGYRVSEYELIISHFNKIHSNGISGMCPFCLKVIDFATEEGNDLEHNQVFFIKHIQRHVLPSSKKCSRCLLNFVNKSVLCDHETQMHISMENNPDVMRYLVDDPTLMPAPIMEPTVMHTIQLTDLKPTGLLKGISTVQLGLRANVPEGLPCHECESPLTSDHLTNYLMCNKCSFRTCCGHAMAEHVSLLHPPYPLSSPVFVGMKTDTGKMAFCTHCNFTTRDGNKMGTHLVTCGYASCSLGKKRIAFPSENISLPAKAQRRGRKQKHYKEREDEDEEGGDVPSPSPSLSKSKTVLNSVGLKRKSIDDESSQEGGEIEETSEIRSDESGEDEGIDPSSALCEVSLEEGTDGVEMAPNVIPTAED